MTKRFSIVVATTLAALFLFAPMAMAQKSSEPNIPIPKECLYTDVHTVSRPTLAARRGEVPWGPGDANRYENYLTTEAAGNKLVIATNWSDGKRAVNVLGVLTKVRSEKYQITYEFKTVADDCRQLKSQLVTALQEKKPDSKIAWP